jgi:penicillin-binding protein 1C
MMKFRLFWPLLLLALLLALAGGFYLFRDLPALEDLPSRLHTPSIRIEDRYGRLLYEAIEAQGGRNAVVSLDAVAPACQMATVATEDSRFYEHAGIDLAGVLRAAWINLRSGETLAGGSTITQQVARNLLLEAGERAQRSLRRKLREAALAWLLTRRFSKDEILALYLNQTYYGGMAYGIEAAAQTFFGKPAAELDLAECALLAGLPQAPALYNPFTDLQAARQRQSVVLRLMEQHGVIDAEQRLLAEREPLVFTETPYPIEAPHFVMMVRSAVDGLFTPQQVYERGGLVVRTTLDLDWQKQAEAAIARHLGDLARGQEGLGHNVNNAALVALAPITGEILALVGSPDFFDSGRGGAINMALAPRQPGSAIKPLVYAAAFDPRAMGGGWTAATMLLDVRTSFLTSKGEAYTPANYDLREHGPVLARQALASSLNIPAVLALEHVGLENFIALAQKLGIQTLGDPQTYDLSLSLGGGEVRLLDLTAAYGSFANRGYRVTPRSILEVRDLQGIPLYTSPAMPGVRVLDERVAWLISDILSDNEARRIGFGVNSLLRLDRPAAVKTGTTSNFHDNWTVGYTPDLVVGVWSGNTNYEPMHAVNGLSGAAPIWHQFMRTVLSSRSPQAFARPAGLEQVEVCALSGLLPTPACPYRRLEWFIEGTHPTGVDNFYRQVWVDPVTGRLAQPGAPVGATQRVVLDLPVQAQPWARSQGLLLYRDLLAATASGGEQSGRQPAGEAAAHQSGALLEMVSPPPGGIYHLSPALETQAQRLRLEAVGQEGLSEVTLYVDGVALAQLDNRPYQAWWTLLPGDHRAWAEAQGPNGERVTSPVVLFTVK